MVNCASGDTAGMCLSLGMSHPLPTLAELLQVPGEDLGAVRGTPGRLWLFLCHPEPALPGSCSTTEFISSLHLHIKHVMGLNLSLPPAVIYSVALSAVREIYISSNRIYRWLPSRSPSHQGDTFVLSHC